jgi:hypothetical protein
MHLQRGIHVKWVPCHHDMVHLHVTDGGDSVQIQRVTANILNKQLWKKADNGWSSNLEFEPESNNSPP